MPQPPSESRRSHTEMLVISPAQERAEALRAALRDAGHDVEVDWLERADELADRLAQRRPDLIGVEAVQAADNELNRLIGLCRNLARDVPVFAIVDELQGERVSALLAAGAQFVVAAAPPELTTSTLAREIELLDLRRQRRDDLHAVRELQKRLDALVAESPEALAYVQEGIHTELNDAYARLFGFEDVDELEGVPLMDLVAPESRDAIKQRLNAAAASDADSDFFSFIAQKADDSQGVLEMALRPAEIGGEPHVEIRIKPDTPIAPAAPTNAFASRAALYQLITDAAFVHQRPTGLLYLCVDEADKLQERMGLAEADRIFDEVGDFLADRSDDDDRCFRFDVSEFVIVTGADSTGALIQQAEALRADIDAQLFATEQASAALTASVAVSLLDESDASLARLAKVMRLARRRSLRDGNAVVADQPDDKAAGPKSDQSWLQRIKTALAEDQFRLSYQGIASLEGEPGQLYDVYLRLLDADGEPVRAGEFLPTAERHGLMPGIDQWVVRAAFSAAAERAQAGDPALLFVKLSRASIEAAEDFLDWLKQLAEQSQASVGDMAIAFDEETLQANVKKGSALAKVLAQAGFKLAIHGFGATSKSLQLLELINADYIKLDPSFTAALVSPDEDQRLLETIQAAQQRNIKIIAAQVEDANSMARLWQAGVNYVQGYFVQEPHSNARSAELKIA